MDEALDKLTNDITNHQISRPDAQKLALELRDGCIASTAILRASGNIWRWSGFVNKLNNIENLINSMNTNESLIKSAINDAKNGKYTKINGQSLWLELKLSSEEAGEDNSVLLNELNDLVRKLE